MNYVVRIALLAALASCVSTQIVPDAVIVMYSNTIPDGLGGTIIASVEVIANSNLSIAQSTRDAILALGNIGIADVCKTNLHPCDMNANCTEPGFSLVQCKCKSGFNDQSTKMFVTPIVPAGTACTDIDECAVNGTACGPHTALCTNSVGSYTCTCNSGYVLNSAKVCVDKCSEPGLNNCSIDATCINTVDSFTCSCNRGFTGNGTTCADIDECLNETVCGLQTASCTNSVGTYTCICNTGYKLILSKVCIDIDECSNSSLSNCHIQAICSNIDGSFTCDCKSGFTGNGTTCADMDECSKPDLNNCNFNATCSNTDGGFSCDCKSGFTGNGTTCADIDKCSTPGLNNCHMQAICSNIGGSFICDCNSRFTGNGITCTDIDECSKPDLNNCHFNAACSNTDGGFSCDCNFGGNNTDCVSSLFIHSENLNPADADALEMVESFLQNAARQLYETNKTSYDDNDQLYIKNVKHNHSEYHSNVMLSSTRIDFGLQTNGVRRLVIAVFVFKINITETAQTQPVTFGSLAQTQYIATLNTTYISIIAWDADSFLSSGRKRSTAAKQSHQLTGNVSYIGPPISLKFFCKEVRAKTINGVNFMINKLEPICLFFDKVENKYSDRGCVTFTNDITGNVTCKCNHLTLFTVLLSVQSITIPKGVKVTSYTTESASIMFLVATIIILYKSKRSGDRVPVQISLSLALLLFHSVNVAHDLAVLNNVTCMIQTIASQYLLLSSGMWFLVEGIRLFMATSSPVEFQTQDSSKRLKIFMLIGWMIPVTIVGISLALGIPLAMFMKPQPLYEHCSEFIAILKYNRCWLAPGTPIFYTTVVSPLAVVLFINFMIVLRTTHVMLHSRKMRNRGEDPGTGDGLRAAKTFILLFFMLGGTWVLSFFTGIGNGTSNEVFMYIHSLVNGLQGIVVFLLYCVIDDEIRQEIFSCNCLAVARHGQQ